MKCISCSSEISMQFRHALEKNECPACGESIMDEESLGLIDHIKDTISSTVKLRDETSHKLAVVIVSSYDISLSNGGGFRPDQFDKGGGKKKKPPKKDVSVKSAVGMPPPEVFEDDLNDVVDELEDEGHEIMTAEQISQAERERILEDVVRKKYNMSSGVVLSPNDKDIVGMDGSVDPSVEADRIERLAKQQEAMESGTGAFRRRG